MPSYYRPPQDYEYNPSVSSTYVPSRAAAPRTVAPRAPSPRTVAPRSPLPRPLVPRGPSPRAVALRVTVPTAPTVPRATVPIAVTSLAAPRGGNGGKIVELTNCDEERAFLDRNTKAVIMFGSAGCGHCKHITPIYNDLARRYPKVGFAHVEAYEVSPQPINLPGVPAFAVYLGGVGVDSVMGSLEIELGDSIARLNTAADISEYTGRSGLTTLCNK